MELKCLLASLPYLFFPIFATEPVIYEGMIPCEIMTARVFLTEGKLYLATEKYTVSGIKTTLHSRHL
jgi:hypothetical protein